MAIDSLGVRILTMISLRFRDQYILHGD